MGLKEENSQMVFNSSLLQNQPHLPAQYVWPRADLVHTQDVLNEPIIDLAGFLAGDHKSTLHAANLVNLACVNHGFFQVTNHGIDAGLIRDAHNEFDSIFNMPISKKLSVRRKSGGISGYSGAHADRFSSKLPWKETFSIEFDGGEESNDVVVHYFTSVLGDDFEHSGRVYQKYCEAMKELSLVIMELLAISLGIERTHYRKYFEDGSSIMRCNYYPPCKESHLTLGTGPHCDPTSLTILHQDQIGGLEVFANNKWHAVLPRPDALVINIGDTFMALSNGKYKSCLHRAIVNKEKERRSLVYFVNPKQDKVVKPHQDLVCNEPRKYPNFTWFEFFHFTQFHYRADGSTLQRFIQWIPSSKTSI